MLSTLASYARSALNGLCALMEAIYKSMLAPGTDDHPHSQHSHEPANVDTESANPRSILNIPLEQLDGITISLDDCATPCRFRLLDCAAFIDLHKLTIFEFPCFALSELSYAAISYPWRDLQLPEGTIPAEGCFSVRGAEHADRISIDVLRTACLAARHYGRSLLWLDRLCLLQTSKDDKNWQIQRMFQIYRHCDPCLVLPGGLVRLALLSEPTAWIDRAWTLQEAAANLTRDTIKCVFSFTQSSFPEFVRELPNPWYTPEFITYLCRDGRFPHTVVEPGRSATCNLLELFSAIEFGMSYFEAHEPVLSEQPDSFPIRIISAPASSLLSRSLVANNAINYQFFWMSAFTRTSSRPVDMVLSIMGPLAVNLPVAEFHENDRLRATIKLIQALMERGQEADWLFIAPELPPSPELSTLPAFPETSESGRAVIKTPAGLVPAFGAVALKEPWRTDRAPTGVMSDSGYFTFRARAAKAVGRAKDATFSKSNVYFECTTVDTEDIEAWAIVIAHRREFNRDPETGQITGYDPDKPFPVITELTLMLVESHVFEDAVYHHRVGMEREIDEGKTLEWDWTEREFSVGGPGRGDRIRFAISPKGPVYM